MIEFTIPHNKPVLIYSSYRSGSTALGDFLSTKLNYKYFGEPYHWNADVRAKYCDFFDYKNKNTNYIWKLFPDHMPTIVKQKEECLHSWSNSYVIKLSRRDRAKQITSWIYSMKTGIWNDTQSVQIPSVSIDDDFIKYCVDKQLLNFDVLDSLPNNAYHVELYYEDILDILAKSNYKPTGKPKNYDDVLEKVTQLIKLKGKL